MRYEYSINEAGAVMHGARVVHPAGSVPEKFALEFVFWKNKEIEKGKK
jgi:hypothetical protein